MTRELTADEHARKEAAWEKYLEESMEAVLAGDMDALTASWDKYQKALADMGIRSTLAGYRIRTHED